MEKITNESFNVCPPQDMLRFLFALCCSSGSGELQSMDVQIEVALHKVEQLANEENTPLANHLSFL